MGAKTWPSRSHVSVGPCTFMTVLASRLALLPLGSHPLLTVIVQERT